MATDKNKKKKVKKTKKSDKPKSKGGAKDKKMTSKKPSTSKAKGQPGSHPSHPACPDCGKAMYKTMVKGKPVKKEDPWAFCRNPNCEKYGVDQDGNASDENKGDGAAPKSKGDKKPKGDKKSKGDKKPKGGKKPKKDADAKITAALKKGKKTQAEIAEKFGVSRKKVRKIRDHLRDIGEL